MPKPSALAYVATLIAILGVLWQAATQWQELRDRVKAIEEKQLYLYGDVIVPKG